MKTEHQKEYPMDYNYADMIADYVSTHRETLEKRAKDLRERNKASRKPKPKKQEPEREEPDG